jgi:hypothetical protein
MMLRRLAPTSLLTLALALPVGCDEGAPSDPASASFGIGKADGPANGYTACELREVLEVVNESTATVATLKASAKMDQRAAAGIVAHRLGPDGLAGSADDDLFDDLAELDAVDYVGPRTLDYLVAFIRPRCIVDLETRPYIDRSTFGSATGGGWTRNEVEIEATFTVTGVTGRRLRDILVSRDSRDRTNYSRLRKSKVMEAFTIDYPVDEIPWSSEAHAARQAMPLMAWSVESGRFEQPAEGGPREISYGTDPNDDTYYDTMGFDLIENGMTLRGRVRFDDANTIRRILIGAKLDSAVDPETGLKKAAKVDVRNDSATHVGTLDQDVRRGKVAWYGSDTPVEPIRVVWQSLLDKALLPTIDSKEAVLLLDPKAHLRSVRSRFHLNFARPESITRLWTNAMDQVRWVLDLARARLASNTLPPADVSNIEAFIRDGEAILDNSAFLAAARAELSALDPALTDIVYPADFLTQKASDATSLAKRRIMAVASDKVLDAFAASLDDLDDLLTGTEGLADAGDWVDPFIAWQKSGSKDLQRKRIARPFYDAWGLLAADKGRAIADFNGFGLAQREARAEDFDDFAALDEATWDALGAYLVDEAIDDSEKMIEAGGSIAQALYFEIARQLYVPGSWRSYSNFIIDTFDWTDMVSHEEWMTIPEADRAPGKDLPADKIFHTTLVNEVQLELTEVTSYVDRIEKLTAELEAAAAANDAANIAALTTSLDGAKWIFDELQKSTQVIANLKGEAILDRLEARGAPSDIRWVPAAHAKGNTALLILTDKL